MMKRRTAIGFILAAILASVPIVYALSLATVSTSITVQDPPISVVSVTFNGGACTASGSTYTCSGSLLPGKSAYITFSLTNPGNTLSTASTTTSIPSACTSWLSIVDNSLSLNPGQSGSLSVTVSVGSGAIPGTACTITTTLSS